MIFILDRNENVINILRNGGGESASPPFFDDILTEDLSTGGETFSFSTIAQGNLATDLSVGNYVAFKKDNKYKLFQIMQSEETHQQEMLIEVYCESAGLELINKVFRKRTLKGITLKRFLETILDETGWNVGLICASVDTTLDIELDDSSVYSILQNNLPKFGVELEFRVEMANGKVSAKYVDTHLARGRVTGKRFTFGKDIEGIKRKSDGTELYTALIGRGKNGIDFKDIVIDGIDKPAGQDFVADQESYNRYNHNGYHVMGIYESDTEDARELLRETYKKLQEVKEVKVEYEVSVALLSSLLGETWNNINIGDTVTIVDHQFNPPIQLGARVSKLETSFTDPEKDNCTLANFVELKSNITDDMRKIASQLEGYVDSQFPIGGDKIQNGAISQEQMNERYVATLTTDILEAGKVVTNELIAENAKIVNAEIETLKAKDAEIENAVIENLEATNAEIEFLKAKDAEIEKVVAEKVTTEELEAMEAKIGSAIIGSAEIINAKINILEADFAEIDTLLAGNITADNIKADSITADKMQTGTITAGSGVIAEGAIGNAQISDIDAGKISAGKIDTSKVEVVGADGHLKIKGNRLQVFQGTGKDAKERVSIGDVNNDGTVYGLRVRGVDGETILLDENGVTQEGITDGSITNDKISGEANIDGSKININSVVTRINEDGTEIIKGNKIDVDGTNLSVKLSTITDKQDENSNRITQNSSRIDATEESIALKVDSQSYTEEVNKINNNISSININLAKNTTSIELLKDSITSKVSQTEVNEIVENKVGNIQIGGRNLWIKSKTTGYSAIEQLGNNHITGQTECYRINNNATMSFNIEPEFSARLYRKVTFSAWVKYENVVQGENSWNQFNCFKHSLIRKNSSSGNTSSTSHLTPYGFSGSSDWKYISYTYDYSADKNYDLLKTNLRFNLEGAKSGTAWVTGIKVEFGGKATDWSPAPEDVNVSISTVDSKVTNISNKTSTLEQNLNSISGRITSTETTISTVEEKIDNIQIGGRNFLLNTGMKKDASKLGLSPEVSRNTSKLTPNGNPSAYFNISGMSSNVWRCVMQDYKGFETGKDYVFSAAILVPTGHSMDEGAAVEVIGEDSTGARTFTKRANVDTSILDKWKTYVCKFEVPNNTVKLRCWVYVVKNGKMYAGDLKLEEGNKATTWSPAPEDINTSIDNIQVGGRNLLVGTATPKSANFNCPTGYSTFDPYTTSGKKTLADLGFKADDEVTISFDWKISKNGTLDEVYGNFRLEWKGIDSTGTNDKYVGLIKLPVDTFSSSNKSGHAVIVTKLDTNSVKAHTLRFRIDNSVLAFTVSNVMVEKGNRASSWTVAPEDVQADINTKANSVDVYKKTETYTKSETDSKINIAKDQISLNVSNTYETKANVETKVNSAVNELKVGGSNVLRNGNFAYDMTNWSVHDMSSGGTSKSVAVENGGSDWKPANKKVLVIRGTNTTDRYGVISSTMKLIPKTKYTISGYCAGHRVNKIQVNVRDRQGSDANIHTININPVSGGSTLDKWHRFETTFTTSSNSDFALNLYSVNLADNGYVWFCDVQIQQGTKATAWTPCLEDINSAIDTKANSTDVYKKTEVYTKNETNSQINAKANEITSSVSSTYETKTNVDTKIKNSYNNRIIYARGTGNEYSQSKLIKVGNSTILNTGTRGLTVVALNPTTLAKVSENSYDTHSGGDYCTNCANKINELNNGNYIIVVVSYDNSNVHNASITTALRKIGGTAFVPNGVSPYREAYALIGKSKLGEGNGVEMYIPRTADDKRFAEISVKISDEGALMGVNSDGSRSLLTNHETRLKSAESKITNDAIVNTVTSSTAWKQTSNVVNQMTQGTRCHKLGAKINYSEFGVQNSGEMYLHGYNSNNEPADVNGSIVFSGVTHTLAKGMVNPNADFGLGVDVYLFKNPNTSHNATYGAYYDTSSNTWKWRGLVGATGSGNISMNEGYIAFGQFNMKDAETFNYATLYNEPVLLKNCVSYKEEVSGQYATKSSLTQTTNSIVAKFEASGGYNLFKNSGFLTGDMTHWGLHQHNSPTASWSILSHSNTWGFPDSSVKTFQIKMSNQTSKEYGLSQTINTTIGKKYTISFYCAAHRANNANIIVRQSGSGSWLSNKYFNPQDSTKNGGNTSVDKWLYVTHTFTATGNSHAINLVLVNAQSDGYFWIAKPQVVEGEAPLSYSPNPSEVYSGNTVIDARGVTVTNGGFKVKNTSNKDVFWVDSNGQATVDNLQVYGNGASTINVYGNGHKHLKFESWTNHGAQISFNQLTGQSTLLVGRMITYPDQGANLYIEADSNIIVRGTRSTTSANSYIPFVVYGDVKAREFHGNGNGIHLSYSGDKVLLKNTINGGALIIGGGYPQYNGDYLVQGSNTVKRIKRASNYFEFETDAGAKGVTFWDSDLKFKKNVQSIKSLKIKEDVPVTGLNLVNSIEHYTFDYKNGKHINVGYVSQQLETIDETLINKIEQPKDSPYWSEEDPYTRQPEVSTILPNVTLAIQEQQQIINAQSIEIEELKQKNEELEKRLKLIEEKLGL